MHDLIPAAPEVVVQAGVLGVQLVIDPGPGGVGEIGGRPGAAHGEGDAGRIAAWGGVSISGLLGLFASRSLFVRVISHRPGKKHLPGSVP